ncbi:MAG TPA: GNAT family N-acetyltransferase [Hyphomicrobiaceae bacterium]|nr:GNAT family N-acetyltransferase [Hyphomicrobiaceae bacterium]
MATVTLPAPADGAGLARRRPVRSDAAAVHQAGLVIDVVRDRAGFEALEREWNDLYRRCGRDTQLFQSFNWNWHWANHYIAAVSARRGPSLAIVTVRRHGRLVVLWPLVARRVGALKLLQWMGEPVSQYGDVLAEDPGDPEPMRQSWRFITTALGADVVHVRKVRADAVVAPLLREPGILQTAVEEAPYLDLASAPDFAAYERRYTAKARKNRRRLARRLAEQGPLAVERQIGGRGARSAALQAIALKRAWVDKTGRLSRALADERFGAFFADVAEGRCRPVGCGVTLLRSSGAAAGIAIDITDKGRCAAHVIVHDPRFDAFSAGTLLLEAWIRGASGDGVATFDLLAPAYAYKHDWADGTVAVGDYAHGATPVGRAYVRIYLGRVRPALKAAAEAWPHLRARCAAAGRRVWPWRRGAAAPPTAARAD